MKKINWRYAIGELIIITIGITLAFALNNWASGIKSENESQEYLQNISNDLHHDIGQLDSGIAKIENHLKYLQKLFPHLRARMPGRDTMAMKVFALSDPVGFKPLEATIESMKYSGDLKLIKDVNLKTRIIEHYGSYEEVAVETERHAIFAKEFLADYFMKNIDYSKFGTEDGYSFLDDSYFHNLVYSLYGIYGIELQAQMKARESAMKLRDLLEAQE